MRQVDFAPAQIRQLVHRKLGRRISRRADAQGDQRFLNVQAQMFLVQDFAFQRADRRDNIRHQQVQFVRYARKMLDGIQNHA